MNDNTCESCGRRTGWHDEFSDLCNDCDNLSEELNDLQQTDKKDTAQILEDEF